MGRVSCQFSLSSVTSLTSSHRSGLSNFRSSCLHRSSSVSGCCRSSFAVRWSFFPVSLLLDLLFHGVDSILGVQIYCTTGMSNPIFCFLPLSRCWPGSSIVFLFLLRVVSNAPLIWVREWRSLELRRRRDEGVGYSALLPGRDVSFHHQISATE